MAGCQFTPDESALVSWSHDCTLRIWDVARARSKATLSGHQDRVTAAAVSPDGAWVASGSRDGTLKLWDVSSGKQVASAPLRAEAKACFFLLDLEWLVSIDAHGRILLHSLPDCVPQGELVTRLAVQSVAMNARGTQIALGCDDGLLHFVDVGGVENSPVVVTATENSRRISTGLQRLFGKSTLQQTLTGTCPACRRAFELPRASASRCPHCGRTWRIHAAPLVPERVR